MHATSSVSLLLVVINPEPKPPYVLWQEGWKTLLAVLLDVGHLRPLWQQTGWTPFGGMCWHGSASAATLSAPLQRHLMDLWKLSGQRREPSWQLSSQEPLVHFHKPQKNVPQINVESLNSARDTQLPGTEATATASPGGPLGPLLNACIPYPYQVCQVRHCPLSMK